MRWRGRRQSSNIEDRRGQGGGGLFPGGFGRQGTPVRIPMGGRGGGLSLTTIIILVVLFFGLRALGIDPLSGLDGSGGGQVSQGADDAGSEETKQFVAVVLAETEDVWNGIFQSEGETYREPTLTRVSGGVRSACGMASSAAGPFYCPGDSKVYLDTGFFQQLASQFGAAGDFAQAYVIAHEVGHHVQNLQGTLGEFNRVRQNMSETDANALSVRVELQADCYAGIWGHYTDQKGLLEQGDLEEALNAAQQIGDDTLQKRTQGYVVPESFNHGTSAQRQEWFSRGFESGRLADCDTFSAQP